MASTSKIEWTEKTWNPIVGCSVVSPGCTNCYAMKMADRIEGMITAHIAKNGGDPGPMFHYEGTTTRGSFGTKPPVWTGKVSLASDHIITAPLHWKRPRMIFVNSMGDLFHESVPDDWIDRVFATMALAPQHTFQVLTKRAERMRDWVIGYRDRSCVEGLEFGNTKLTFERAFSHVWLGVSAEDQQRADERIPHLLETPAAVRFVSAEPLLGPIDFRYLQPSDPPVEIDALNGTHGVLRPHGGTSERLDWIIVGGESGPGARPFKTEWAHSIVDQCETAGVPCFVKQLGSNVYQNGEHIRKRDRKGGDMSEWPHEIRVRQFPKQGAGQ